MCVTLSNRSAFFCCIYIPPNSNPAVYSEHTAAVQQLLNVANPDDIVIALGDYNLPYLTWHFDEDICGYLPRYASSEHEIAFTEGMQTTGLCQINDLANRNGRLFDLVFVNEPYTFELLEPPSALLKVDHHHKPLVLPLDANRETIGSEQHDQSYLDFKACDYETLSTTTSAVHWDDLLDNLSVDDAVTRF